MTVTLHHDDVMVRPMKESDIKRLWKLTTPQTFLYMLNEIKTFEEFDKWMRDGFEQMENSNTTIVFVVAHSQTDELFGSTRIYNFDYTNKSCEIGSTYYGKNFQRTHINTTVKWLLFKYVFETLGMIRVQLKTDEENLISQKAIERIGATKEGILRNERIRSTGRPRNAVLYSIIQEEWKLIKYKLEERMHNYT
ncbi:GNAT family N-acetyltransferase [Paenisporosarcina sp. TG20]|uniref:GNAT family N-acetyltransferase n=1 Tax=Paenisporosarcina sp. TG20 TaxID=1211706 RepID=UPI0002DC21E7|nr:GNAT family protein [Paenisporosarcina sp. TG20]